MDILKQLNWRYATKKFSTQKLPHEKIDTIIEAGRLAATSYGLQAFKIVNVVDPVIRAALVEHSWGQQQVADASHLLVLCSLNKLEAGDVDDFMNRVSTTRNVPQENLADYGNRIKGTLASTDDNWKQAWMGHQVHIALGQMMTVAALLEVDTCPMGGFVPEKYDEILGLDAQGLKSVVVLTVGYRATDDQYQYNAKVRRSREDFEVII